MSTGWCSTIQVDLEGGMSDSKSSELAARVGEAIARHRVRCDLSQEQVAEKLGIGSEAVSRIERGVVTPNVERLLGLAEIFNCEVADLLTDGSSRTEDQARKFFELLSKLDMNDRTLVMEVVERLVSRLARD
jgi:transcriptional regulator with XRE-family HTH domain